MEARLPAHVEASALLRVAEAGGGFGTILKKGDPDRGAIVLLVTARGSHAACLERTLAPDGGYTWLKVGPIAGSTAEVLDEWLKKRVRFDEDLWLIELDVVDPERFIAETTLGG